MQFVHSMFAFSTHPGQINYFERSVVIILGIKTVKKIHPTYVDPISSFVIQEHI